MIENSEWKSRKALFLGHSTNIQYMRDGRDFYFFAKNVQSQCSQQTKTSSVLDSNLITFLFLFNLNVAKFM